MQKLFSMFPLGAPGIALLLLRFSVAAAMLVDGWGRLSALTPPLVLPLLAALALALCVGFMTPIFSLACAAIEMIGVFGFDGFDVVLSATLIVNAIALAMLGPGGYSIDARLFGRRVMVIPSDTD
jgi:uncharacterized membrane protein YphA (DoxX/SURF4 family)